MERIDSGEKQGGGKKVSIIIAIVIAVVLCVMIPLLLNRGQTSEPTPLELLQAKVATLETNLASVTLNVTLKVAGHTEDLANLNEEIEDLPDWGATIQALQDGLQNVTARLDALPDWSLNYTALSGNLTAFGEVLDNILEELSACNCTGNLTG